MNDVAILESVKIRQARKGNGAADLKITTAATSMMLVAQPESGFTGVPATATSPTKDSEKPSGLIPGLDERPCWRVLEDFTDSERDKLRPGVWFFGVKSKGDGPQVLTQTYVCGPLHIVAVTTNTADGNYGRLLRFKTTLGKWKTWAMPMELLKGDGTDLRGKLLYMGLELDPMARHLLPQYIQHKTPKNRIRCTEQTGWAGGDCAAFVLPDAV